MGGFRGGGGGRGGGGVQGTVVGVVGVNRTVPVWTASVGIAESVFVPFRSVE